MKRAGPKPHLVLTCMGVCLVKLYCLQPCCHCGSVSEAAASQELRHPWEPLLVILLLCHCSLDPPLPPAPSHTPVGPDCCSFLCLLSIKSASFWPSRAPNHTPVPRLGLRIIIADCPAANTCPLTLISRNFMPQGDGGELTNKMLQVL